MLALFHISENGDVVKNVLKIRVKWLFDMDILRDLLQPIYIHMGTHCSEFHILIAYFIVQKPKAVPIPFHQRDLYPSPSFKLCLTIPEINV